MTDLEFIKALQTKCEQLQESNDKVANENNEFAGYLASSQATAYWSVVKMIEVYLEERENNE